MILDGGSRRHFLEKKMTYLFSQDVALIADTIGYAAGGVRINLRGRDNSLAPEDDRHNRSEVFHALGDESVMGHEALAGKVVWFDERLLITGESDVGRTDSTVTVRTSDGALIWSRYRGRLRLGRLGLRRLLVPVSNESASTFQAKAFVTPRFETDSSRYKWLTERQCVAYGRLDIKDGVIASASYDVYATG